MFLKYFNMKKIFLLILTIIALTSCNKDNNLVNIDDIKKKEEEIKESANKIVTQKNLVGKNKVTLTLFYLSTCPHCHNEIKWLEEIKDDYDYLNIVKYEANENEKLYDLVLEKMNIDSYYVPLNIIGNYYNTGFSESDKQEYLSVIQKYSSGEYCDVVDAIINNKDIESCIKINKSVDLSN